MWERSLTSREEALEVYTLWLESIQGLIMNIAKGDNELHQELNFYAWKKMPNFTPEYGMLTSFFQLILQRWAWRIYKYKSWTLDYPRKSDNHSEYKEPLTEIVNFSQDDYDYYFELLKKSFKPRWIDMFIDYYYHDLTLEEVGVRHDGISKQAVWQVIQKVHKGLNEILNEENE
jgi:hypothetical protein